MSTLYTKYTNEELIDSQSPKMKQRKGDIAGVYDRHIHTVYRVCFAMMGNKQDAEDATQSVFIKLMENAQQFNSVEHEKAWLITTARNHCLDQHRKWWRKKTVDFDTNLLEQTGQEAEYENEINDYLRKLSPKYRIVLYLYYYEGYKIAEIAELLQLNINTVKTHMRKARKKLRLEIGDDFLE